MIDLQLGRIGDPRGLALVLNQVPGVVENGLFVDICDRLVIVDHGNGYVTYYAHLSVIYVSMGQSVDKGALVGAMGSTGNSSGPHVHFEVHRNGKIVNPKRFVR